MPLFCVSFKQNIAFGAIMQHVFILTVIMMNVFNAKRYNEPVMLSVIVLSVIYAVSRMSPLC